MPAIYSQDCGHLLDQELRCVPAIVHRTEVTSLHQWTEMFSIGVQMNHYTS